MSDRLRCQTLHEFFGNINWQGIVTKPIDQSSDCPDDLNLKCQTVNEFFSRVNWQGRALSITSQQKTGMACSVTLPVEELFSLFIWEDKPEIAILPQFKPSSSTMTSSSKIDLKNLTDLF